MTICLTHNCNNRAIPGSDYCLMCHSRQSGHGGDGAAMVIPAISTISPYTIQFDDDVTTLQAIAEVQDRLKRCKAELDRQRERYADQKGDLWRAEYTVEQQDETIQQQAETIRQQAAIIRRQQAKLDGRMISIRALKEQMGTVIGVLQVEQNYADGLSKQLDQLRATLMQVPFVGHNGSGEWQQTAQDDVTPLENGFCAQYAKLDPVTFEVNTLFWYRAK